MKSRRKMYSHNFLSSLNHLQKVTKNEISDNMKKTLDKNNISWLVFLSQKVKNTCHFIYLV